MIAHSTAAPCGSRAAHRTLDRWDPTCVRRERERERDVQHRREPTRGDVSKHRAVREVQSGAAHLHTHVWSWLCMALIRSLMAEGSVNSCPLFKQQRAGVSSLSAPSAHAQREPKS
jgi:hypothetical protein